LRFTTKKYKIFWTVTLNYSALSLPAKLAGQGKQNQGHLYLRCNWNICCFQPRDDSSP